MSDETPTHPHESPPPPPRRRTVLKVLLAVGTVVVTLGLVEGGLRLVGYGADRGPCFQGYNGAGIRLMCYDRNLNDYLDIDLTDPAVRRHFYERFGVIDMEKTYHYTPYAVMTPCDEREMRPGQLRVRRRVFDGEAPKVRLIAVGDSFTYGHGLKPGDPWPRQLEGLLNAVCPDRFEVLNCGIGDTDVAATTHLFMTELQGLEPNAVIYGWYLNDPIQSLSFAEAHRRTMSDSREQARHIPDRYISVGWEEVSGWRRWSALYDLVHEKLRQRSTGRGSLDWINGMYGERNAEGWAKSQELLALIDKTCRSKGARLHVVIWPMLIDLGEAYPLASAHRAISEACKRLGIPCLDLRPALRGRPLKRMILHPEDRHPSTWACTVAAEAVRDHLRQVHPAWFEATSSGPAP